MRIFKKIKYTAFAVVMVLTTVTATASAHQSGFDNDPSKLKMRDKYAFQMENMVTVTYGSQIPEYSTELERLIAEGFEDYTGEDIFFGVDSISGSVDDIKSSITELDSLTAVLWDEDNEWLEIKVVAPEKGFYNLIFTYHDWMTQSLDAVREIYIDGTMPYRELAAVTFAWNWQEKYPPVKNAIGDEIVPPLERISEWLNNAMTDTAGYYAAPIKLALEKGEHVIRMGYVSQSMALAGVSLAAPEVVPDYAKVKAGYDNVGYKNAKSEIYFESEENITGRNSSTLRRAANDDPLCKPLQPGYKRLNTIGGTYWNKGGQELEWSFDVLEDGLYKIGMRTYQAFSEGMPVYRSIKIDGKTPFSELMEYSFPFKEDFYYMTLADTSGEPYLFYLTKGKHTLSMSVRLGEYTPLLQSFNYDSEILSDYILKVNKITGPLPDANYDYEIEKNIPETKETLSLLIESLQRKMTELRRICGRNTPAINSLGQSVSQLKDMLDNPESIPRRSDHLSDIQNGFTTWYQAFSSQPLTLDNIRVSPPDTNYGNAASNVFQKASATWSNFITSFTKDYERIGENKSGSDDSSVVLDVWVSMGIESAEILKNLVDDQFSPSTGIYINVNVLPAGQLNAGAVNAMLLSLAAGTEPDVALTVATGTPVEFAIRDAAVDFSELQGYDKVAEWFLPSSIVPNTFMGGVYGLPETLDFQVMFYRKDIFASLGLGIPQTWDDMYNNTLPVLFQNQMNMYVPNNIGLFLFQKGGSFFTEDGLDTNLATDEGYAAFAQMIELYSSYGLPFYSKAGTQTLNFFNRFRIGNIPIGISGFGDYMQFLVGAPELAGKWDIAPIPGTMKEDGVIDRSFGGLTSSTAMMFSSSDKIDEGWEFIKWWLSTDTQVTYGQEREARIGVGARSPSANIEAYVQMPWKRSDLDTIRASWEWANETPGVLGGYYTWRHLDNAWNRLMIDKGVYKNRVINVRDSFEMGVEEIKKELTAKQEEYSHLLKRADISPNSTNGGSGK